MCEITECRSCRASIVYVPTQASGALIPLDVDPVDHGNIVIRDGKALYVKKDLYSLDDELRYVSHFATCPQAARFRKTK
jgi:hypothetical protein